MSESDAENQNTPQQQGSAPQEGDEGITADLPVPEDLQPGDDNPLAGGLEPGETEGDLLEDGKPAEAGEEQSGDQGADGSDDGSDEGSKE